MTDHSPSGQLETPAGIDLRSQEDEAFRQAARGALDLRYLVATIRSNIWLLAAVILGALAIAVLATLLDTPRYTAAATIQINDTSDRVIGNEDDSTAQSSNVYDTDRFLKTQTDVLRSRNLATRVAQKLKLVGNASFYRAMEAEGPSGPGSQADQQSLAISLLEQNVTVKLPRDSRVVTVEFESAHPAIAAQVANAYVSEFIQANLQRKYDSTSYARDFVANQMTEAKIRLEASERELNDYSRSAGLIRTRDAAQVDGRDGRSSGGSVTTASLLQINAAANDARAQRIVAEGRWRSAAAGSALGSREVLANGAVATLMTERARAGGPG